MKQRQQMRAVWPELTIQSTNIPSWNSISTTKISTSNKFDTLISLSPRLAEQKNHLIAWFDLEQTSKAGSNRLKKSELFNRKKGIIGVITMKNNINKVPIHFKSCAIRIEHQNTFSLQKILTHVAWLVASIPVQ